MPPASQAKASMATQKRILSVVLSPIIRTFLDKFSPKFPNGGQDVKLKTAIQSK
jgi:hypothetical protein